MGKFSTLVSQAHSLAGPSLSLIYPLYASVLALESTSKLDDEQWLAYWILYSFLTLVEMVMQPALEFIPIWYDVKLLFVGWLVLPQFKGAAFLYERFVREQLKKYRGTSSSSSSSSQTHKGKTAKFVDFIIPSKSMRLIKEREAKVHIILPLKSFIPLHLTLLSLFLFFLGLC
uniref:HVA22-like protein n=1 Tax=Cannabis sativa TaxID=3483 RepID=A0A803QXW5_CANSA